MDSPCQTHTTGAGTTRGADATVASSRAAEGLKSAFPLAEKASTAGLSHELHESGDRWILDTLIPNRDRKLVGSQIPRTSKPKVATKPVLIKSRLVRQDYAPIHSAGETGLEEQARLRRRYNGEDPLPGDRIL